MKNVLSLAVTLGLTVSTVVPTSVPLKAATQTDTSFRNINKAIPKAAARDAVIDGINDGWKQDSATQKGGEIAEIANGMLHLKAGAQNGNSASDTTKYPAVFVNDKSFDFTKPGYFSTTLTSVNGGSNDRFGIYLGYDTPGNGLFIGYDAGGWFWQKYQNGDGDYYTGNRQAAPTAGTAVKVKIEWDENHKAKLILDNQTIFENLDFSSMKIGNKIGIKLGTYGTQLTEVNLKGMDYTGLNAPVVKYAVRGTVTDEKGAPIANAKVSIGDESVSSDDSGNYQFAKNFITGDYTLKVSKSGYQDASQKISVGDSDLVVGAIQLTPETIVTDTINSTDMQVELYKNFPAVRKYTMSKMGNKVFNGQENSIHNVAINGKNITLEDSAVTYKKVNDNEAQYTLNIKDDANHIAVVMTVQMLVDGNKLHFNVTKIENQAGVKYPVQTIAFPNQSLISVNSKERNASLTGAVMSSDTNKTGDETIAVTDTMNALNNRDYMYAFISDDELSAGLWSNSEHDGRAVASVAGGGTNTRIFATTTKDDNRTSLGLTSAPWYYQRIVKDSHGNSYTVPQTDLPKMSVVIAGDENKDDTINWQDGAIAFRSIMNNPYKSEEVPELVSYRIAMNFGSQAQNPFLTTLDNVKKVALNTDGLGQSVLLKGYANEGHDSGHPDYGDVGKRIGGVKDFNTLMEKGKAYGARFGVHVNASEMYPEAKAFTEDLIRRNANGSLRYGWNWLDQAVGIDGIYDLASGAREARFGKLKAEVGDNLDFIYLDVWGNQTSGAEDSWETRKMSKMINDNGWRMTNEWGAANEYDSTFQHWAADLTYGGSGLKGINSQVMRFLRNQQKDSWDGDYPSYGGAANAPLLGGYSMKDFEGWQGRNDYDAYINNLYTHDVSTKWLQHYKVTSWLNNPLDATAPKDANVNGGNEQITLKDDANNTVVVSRKSNDKNSADYRVRTMTLNGKTVLSGAVSKGDGKGKGDESYLLPWNWDVNTGKAVASEKEKFYHWNTKGGETTWNLPDNWKSLASVKIYKLTDLGKTDEKTVPIKNGAITLSAEAETPYVITKSDEAPIDVTWSEGMHIVDAGFNSGEAGLKKYWKTAGSGSANIAMSQFSNPMLKLTGDVETTQKLTDLEAGKEYAMYVGVDNRSTGNASAIVSANGKEIGENYTGESIAKNYVKAYTHNTNSATVDGKSYFQNMYVFFTAPKDGSTVELTLKHEGQGDTYFDDVRVVENNSKNIQLDEKGNLKSFTNDFEQNAQGIYPFVVGGSEGVEDNRIHLSELHAPYTQAGWDVKKMDDVLDGNWSVKINGLVQKDALIYQTIPQNIHFAPGAKYKISFKYQAGSDDTYAVAVGSGEYNASKVKLMPLKKALGTSDTYEFELTGALAGDSWFGIYSTSKAPDLQGTSGSASDFGGYKDFILDDLKVEQVQETFSKADAEQKLAELSDTTKYPQANYSASAYQVYKDTLVQAKVLINKDNATADDYQKAYTLLRALESYMETAPGREDDAYYDVDKAAYSVTAGSAQADTGQEGPATYAQDGNSNTWWHTNWGDTNLNNAWYEFDLKEPTTIDGLRYLPRPGGAATNGKIKDYDIILTVADGTNARDAKEVKVSGTFLPNTAWQKKSFAPVKNVIKVRFKVNSSAGSSAASENHFAAAAGLYVTTPKATIAEKVDKTALESAIQSVSKLQEKDYTTASWKLMQTKLAAANSVLKNDDATAYDVALATTNLQDAIHALEAMTPPAPTTVDKTKLDAAIANAKTIDTSKYTEETVKVMKTALDNAMRVQSDDKATQADVDAATMKLNEAVQGLKLNTNVTIDKTTLLNKLNEAIKMNKDAYTADSYQALVKAIENAQAVIGNPKATQKDIEHAYMALEKAMQGLVPVPHGTPAKPGSGSVDTGDTTNMGILLFVLIVAGGAVVVLLMKRNKKDVIE